MSTSTIRARHRAARRPVTPLTSLASAATGSIGTVGRRAGIVAASSGLIVSMLGGPAAQAAPSSDTSNKLSAVDLDAVTAAAKAAIQTSTTVTVKKNLTWTADVASVKVKPAPEPVRTPTVSRSTTRTALSTTTATPAAASASTATTSASTQGTGTTAASDDDGSSTTPSDSGSSSGSTGSSGSSTSVPGAASGSAVIAIASRYVGVPYVYGGSTPSGFDCSGFTSYVYRQLGVSLSHSSSAQRGAGTVVSRAAAKPGDLIWTPGHVAIYAGGNMMIDAPRPGKTIQFRPIWQSNPTFIRVTG